MITGKHAKFAVQLALPPAFTLLENDANTIPNKKLCKFASNSLLTQHRILGRPHHLEHGRAWQLRT